MNHYSRAPLIRLAIPFIAGIVLSIHLPFQLPILGWFLLFLFLVYAALVVFSPIAGSFRFRPVTGLMINFFLLLAGYHLCSLRNDIFNPKHFRHHEGRIFKGHVLEEMQSKAKSVKTVLQITGVFNGKSWNKAEGRLLVYFRPDERSKKLKINDRIVFQATVAAIPEPGNPGEFNYKKYLSHHQVFHQAYIDSARWDFTNEMPGFSLFRLAQEARRAMLGAFARHQLTGKEFAVASALVLGFKDELSPELVRAYSGAGAMHVLAVSGLHVGIIYLALNFMLKFLDRFRYGRVIKAILLVLALWAYAMVTGMSPSVMRAATMFSFVVAGKAFKRGALIYNSLAASAFVLLLFNPYLIMQVGFQLSYLAVFGIVYIQPRINNWFYFENKFYKWVWGITAVSLAAQIATFPLGLLYFHQFPNYFLFSNLIVIPGAMLILSSGLALLVLEGIANLVPFVSLLATGLAFCFKYIVWSLNYIVEWIEKLPHSITKSIYISDFQVWLIYLMTVALLAFFAHVKPRYLLASLALFAVFLVDGLVHRAKHLGKGKLIVYNIRQRSAIDIVYERENILMTDLCMEKDYNSFLFHISNNWIKSGLRQSKVMDFGSIDFSTRETMAREGFVRLRSKLFYALGPGKTAFPEMVPKIRIDGLLVSKDSHIPNLERAIHSFEIGTVVMDASNSASRIKKAVTRCMELNLDYYVVTERGAFIAEAQ